MELITAAATFAEVFAEFTSDFTSVWQFITGNSLLLSLVAFPLAGFALGAVIKMIR